MPTQPTSWYSLPKDKGVAYAAQESWIQNETIKENILFGSPYEEERYKKGWWSYKCTDASQTLCQSFINVALNETCRSSMPVMQRRLERKA